MHGSPSELFERFVISSSTRFLNVTQIKNSFQSNKNNVFQEHNCIYCFVVCLACCHSPSDVKMDWLWLVSWACVWPCLANALLVEMQGECGMEQSSDRQFPFMVSLQRFTQSGVYEHFCGATILAKHWILTAAHCLKPFILQKSLQNLTALVGTDWLNDTGGVRMHIDMALIHEHYQSYRNDIGLVKTLLPIQMKSSRGHSVSAICLPATPVIPMETATIAGWGATKPGVDDDDPMYLLSNELRHATVTRVPIDQCARAYKQIGVLLPAHLVLCFGDNRTDSCQVSVVILIDLMIEHNLPLGHPLGVWMILDDGYGIYYGAILVIRYHFQCDLLRVDHFHASVPVVHEPIGNVVHFVMLLG